ncbi:hypothetical protein [Pengzhenrongella sp.]|jgi:hypothetical protein|uniref:hypothetical protein n=1 Tax=Pengzhenrongella sp. TaxID=2888820 RepID=UPI002F94FDF8
MNFSVNLDALEHDARLWDGAATTLATAGSTAAELNLSAVQLSWAATDVGLEAYYESARARAQRLLTEGGEETALIASTLRKVKADYEAIDVSAQERLVKLWKPTP